MFSWLWKSAPRSTTAGDYQLDRERYDQLLKLPLVQVFPLTSNEQTEPEVLFGVGLARRLTRDLSLLPVISTRGADDTPAWALEQVTANRSPRNPTLQVSGRTERIGEQLRTDLYLFAPGRDRSVVVTVERPTIESLLAELRSQILIAVGIDPTDPAVTGATATASPLAPPTAEGLIELGRIATQLAPLSPERTTAALALASEHPSLACALHAIDAADRRSRKAFADAAQADPLDPQLQVLLFQSLWNGQRGDRVALSHLDRALALSPGLGKAHLWKSVAANFGQTPSIVWHAELAYRFLPGNPLVVDHYEAMLEQAAGRSLLSDIPASTILEVRRQLLTEALEIDPANPDRQARRRALS